MSETSGVNDDLFNEIHADHSSLPSLDILLGIKNRIDETLIKSLLSQNDHPYQAVDNGLMVLQCLEKQRFDLCLLSYDLPGLSGPDTAKAIRSNCNPSRNIPVIGILNYSAQLIIADCHYAGMNSFIGLPYTEHKLLALIRYYQNKINQTF